MIRLGLGIFCLIVAAVLLYLPSTWMVNPIDAPSIYGFAGIYGFVGVATLIWRAVQK